MHDMHPSVLAPLADGGRCATAVGNNRTPGHPTTAAVARNVESGDVPPTTVATGLIDIHPRETASAISAPPEVRRTHAP